MISNVLDIQLMIGVNFQLPFNPNELEIIAYSYRAFVEQNMHIRR